MHFKVTKWLQNFVTFSKKAFFRGKKYGKYPIGYKIFCNFLKNVTFL